MYRAVATALAVALALASPAACDLGPGHNPPPTPGPTPSVVTEPRAGFGVLTEGGETCGPGWEIRMVGRILDAKGKALTGRTFQMTALNLQGFGEIIDAKGIHVDSGYSTRVTAPFVMCLATERVFGQPFTYHVRLKFAISASAGRSVECTTFDSAWGLGLLSLGHEVGPTEATCEYRFPEVK